MERDSFIFPREIHEALFQIVDLETRGVMYHMICEYALNNYEDFDVEGSQKGLLHLSKTLIDQHNKEVG